MAKRKAARRRRPAPGRTKRARQATPTRESASARGAKGRIRQTHREAVQPQGRGSDQAQPSQGLGGKVRLDQAALGARQAQQVGSGKAARRPEAGREGRRQGLEGGRQEGRAPASCQDRPPRAQGPPLAKPLPPELAKRKHVLNLGRDRRRVLEDDLVSPTPPSSLGLDRSASAARSGRQELRERYDKHNETSPALTGGDVDARLGIRLQRGGRSARRGQPDARPERRGRHRRRGRRGIRRQRGTGGRRSDRRARPAPLGIRPGLVRRLRRAAEQARAPPPPAGVQAPPPDRAVRCLFVPRFARPRVGAAPSPARGAPLRPPARRSCRSPSRPGRP